MNSILESGDTLRGTVPSESQDGKWSCETETP